MTSPITRRHKAIFLVLQAVTISLVTVAAAGPAAPAARAGGGATSHVAPLPIQGMWVWKKQYVQDAGERDQMLAFCKRQGFNRLLVQLPWKPGSVQDGKPEMLLKEELRQLLARAREEGITVEALDGAPEMARKANWDRTLAQLDAVLAFNASLPSGAARFAGMHWDIEPYTRPDWKTPERAAIMLEYVQFLAKAKARLNEKAPDMTLAVDIPMWYDHKTEPGDTCVLEFGGKTKNFHEHIQDLTDYVGIMSYRQHALGANSVTEHVENELAYAEKIGKFVCPALETIKLDETPQITFYGQTAEKFLTEKGKVEAALKGRAGYGGILVHHYPSVRDLLEGKGR